MSGPGVWDIAVIGAGPAGAIAAREAAQRGASVLLIDRHRFPRPKVCGCCLNRAAIATLERVDLRDTLAALRPPPLHTLRLQARGAAADLPLPGGVAVSRLAFDAALVEAAREAGGSVREGCTAHLERLGNNRQPHRIRLRGDGGEATMIVEARVLVVADGLGGRFADQVPGLAPRIAPTSRVGAGAMLKPGDPARETHVAQKRSPAGSPGSTDGLRNGIVHMTCGRGGYIGMVRLEDGALDVAAAFDLDFIQRHGGPGPAAAALLHEAGADAPFDLPTAAWRGTPRLTRHRPRLTACRLFITGDAAGYAEPFTGEGMAWALAGGAAVADFAVAAAERWDPRLAARWERAHRQLVRPRQRTCHMIAALLRRPRLTAAAVRLAAIHPRLLHRPLRRVGRPDYASPGGRPPAEMVNG